MSKTNKILTIYFVTIFLGVIISNVIANECKADSLVDPRVTAISVGPKKEYGTLGEGYYFMVILTLSEIYYHVYVEEITSGEEGCCLKITRCFQIRDEDLSGRFGIKSFQGVKWLNPTSFIITLNEHEKFIIRDLDKNNYKVDLYKDK